MNKPSEWLPIDALCVVLALCGILVVVGIALQWGQAAGLIAIGAYGIIGSLAVFGFQERKKSIAEFEEKSKKASTRYEEMRAQNAKRSEEIRQELNDLRGKQ